MEGGRANGGGLLRVDRELAEALLGGVEAELLDGSDGRVADGRVRVGEEAVDGGVEGGVGDRGVALAEVAVPALDAVELVRLRKLGEGEESFGAEVPLERPGQPAEVAPVYVMLASDEASYVSGARIAVTGGKPIL